MKIKILLAAMCVSLSLCAMDQSEFAHGPGLTNDLFACLRPLCGVCGKTFETTVDNNQPLSIAFECAHVFHITCLDQAQNAQHLTQDKCPCCAELSHAVKTLEDLAVRFPTDYASISTAAVTTCPSFTLSTPVLYSSSVPAIAEREVSPKDTIVSKAIATVVTKVQGQENKFNGQFKTCPQDYNKYILSVFAEGAAWGSTMYLLYKACMLQELSGIKWWAIQGIATAATLRFAEEMDFRYYALKNIMVLWLAHKLGYTKNIAHLCLLNNAMSWWVPLSKYAIAQTNECIASYNYQAVRESLANNYKQKAILCAGNIAGACLVGPLVNIGLSKVCTYAFQQAGQALNL